MNQFADCENRKSPNRPMVRWPDIFAPRTLRKMSGSVRFTANPEGRVRIRESHRDRQSERRLDRVDRKRNSVERDRPLRRDEARKKRAGVRNVSRAISARSSRVTSSAMPSTWPLTMWPPSSSLNRSARSRGPESGRFLPACRCGHAQGLGRGIGREVGPVS